MWWCAHETELALGKLNMKTTNVQVEIQALNSSRGHGDKFWGHQHTDSG